MTDQVNLTIYNYKKIFNNMEPAIAGIVTEMTGKAVGHIDSHRGTTAEILKETGQMLRRDILDKMLNRAFVNQILSEQADLPEKLQIDWLHRLSFLIRKIAPELVISESGTIKDAPVGIWLFGGVSGALAGVILPALLNLNPELRLSIAMGTSPICVICTILSIRWISMRTKILTRITGMRSKDLMDPDQVRINIRNAVESWIKSQLLILFLLAKLIPVKEESSSSVPDKLPDSLLAALMKLIQAPVDKRISITEEIILEFRHAGYEVMPESEALVWNESLNQHYDVLGIISPGDECRVLQKPIIQGNEIRRKGRLTRKR